MCCANGSYKADDDHSIYCLHDELAYVGVQVRLFSANAYTWSPAQRDIVLLFFYPKVGIELNKSRCSYMYLRPDTWQMNEVFIADKMYSSSEY